MLLFLQDFAQTSLGLGSLLSFFLGFVSLSFIVFLLCFLADFVAKTYLVKLFNLFISKANYRVSGFLKNRQVVRKLSRVGPGVVLYVFSPAFFSEAHAFTSVLVFSLKQASLAYILLTMVRSFFGILDVVEDVYNQYEVSKKRPIKSYLQIGKIIFTFLGLILFVSLLLDRSPLAFFTGLGAAATILVLIFKDSIASFLASIQVSSYDMIRIGDWINVSKYGADGDVIEISLTTVKVRNFDKTITTVPTYALMTEGVQNWRGMQESGGRRIKRSIRLDLYYVKFCDEAFLEKFKSQPLLRDFCESRGSTLVSGISNVALFRDFAEFYLRAHKNISSDGSFTFLVRELQPDENGLPVELYVFTKTTVWSEYEVIQAEVMDFLLSSLSLFGLRSFQRNPGSLVSLP